MRVQIPRSLRPLLIFVAALVSLLTPPARATDPQPDKPDIKEISKKLDNPFSDLWLLYFENDVGFYDGFPARETKVINTFLLNPVLSFPLPGQWTLLTRPAVPIITAPKPQIDGEFGSFPDHLPAGGIDELLDSVKTDVQTELGDIGLPLNVAPPLFDIPGTKGKGFAAAGVMLMFPTSTDDLFGSDQFSMGPAGALGYIGEQWIFGVSLQHWKDVAGKKDARDVHASSIQYFISYKLPNLWSIGMSPKVFVNWEARNDNKLTFPVGLSVGKTMMVGGLLPVRAGIEGNYSVIHPDDFGRRWVIKATMTVVVPSPFGSLVGNPAK